MRTQSLLHRLCRVAAPIACAIALLASARVALAERVTTTAPEPAAPERSVASDEARLEQLGEIVTRKGGSDKSKLSAIAALARLGDRRAARPLIAALADPSATVRAIAAAALGKVGAKSALAPLRQATGDDNEQVRLRAKEAIRAIIKANDLSDESAQTGEGKEAGFGRQARTTEKNPDLFVVVKTCNDDSPGRSDKKTRAAHADILRAAMNHELAEAPLVTGVATVAKRLSLPGRAVDATVVKLAVRTKGNMLVLETELRLVISDETGKMLSMLTGGAKVSVPKQGFRWSTLPALRKNVIEGAVQGLFAKLLAHLRSPVTA